ncbi:hypothetical protein HY357_01295, partial [Candidatus Roizmanbacteria bacterium]|nr:hypothetical protein [Candidatus Roizmanbacteria bacterium]
MNLVTEVLEDKSSILVISKENYDFVKQLKFYFKKYSAGVFISPTLPLNLK